MSIPIRPNPIGPMALLTRVTVMVGNEGKEKQVRKVDYYSWKLVCTQMKPRKRNRKW